MSKSLQTVPQDLARPAQIPGIFPDAEPYLSYSAVPACAPAVAAITDSDAVDD